MNKSMKQMSHQIKTAHKRLGSPADEGAVYAKLESFINETHNHLKQNLRKIQSLDLEDRDLVKVSQIYINAIKAIEGLF